MIGGYDKTAPARGLCGRCRNPIDEPGFSQCIACRNEMRDRWHDHYGRERACAHVVRKIDYDFELVPAEFSPDPTRTPVEILIARELDGLVAEVLTAMFMGSPTDRRAARVLYARFFDEHTLSAIAKVEQVTPERARQIEHNAIRYARRWMFLAKPVTSGGKSA